MRICRPLQAEWMENADVKDSRWGDRKSTSSWTTMLPHMSAMSLYLSESDLSSTSHMSLAFLTLFAQSSNTVWRLNDMPSGLVRGTIISGRECVRIRPALVEWYLRTKECLLADQLTRPSSIGSKQDPPSTGSYSSGWRGEAASPCERRSARKASTTALMLSLSKYRR